MKRSPIKRKKSLRDAYADKIRREGFPPNKPRTPQEARKRSTLPRSTPKRAKEQSAYLKARIAFLSRPENEFCHVCKLRAESGEDCGQRLSTETHHSRGRIGRLLLAEEFWLAVCSSCHSWLHDNPKKAREIGALVPSAQWNVYPA